MPRNKHEYLPDLLGLIFYAFIAVMLYERKKISD
jgi:hypothetical protein